MKLTPNMIAALRVLRDGGFYLSGILKRGRTCLLGDGHKMVISSDQKQFYRMLRKRFIHIEETWTAHGITNTLWKLTPAGRHALNEYEATHGKG